MKTLIIIATALALPTVALAQAQPKAQPAPASVAGPTVSLLNKAFVVRKVPDGKGGTKNTLAPVDKVFPGDALAFVFEYKNAGTKPAAAFVINNTVPENILYTGNEQPWAVVSVDRGLTFGPLATLKVKNPDGSMRAAQPTDVTDIRWKFAQPIPAGGSGRVAYYAVVK